MVADTFDASRDLALVAGFLANEETAIREFSDRLRCVPRILAAENVRRGRPLNEHDLADLVQDTVIVILRKADQFAGAAPLEGWIYRVCCLEFMNGLRRTRRREVQEPPDRDPVDDRVDTVDSMGAREALYRGLEQLDVDEAEAVHLKHFEGLTFEEMGHRLGASPNTCKTRYYRGLARLERLLRNTLD